MTIIPKMATSLEKSIQVPFRTNNYTWSLVSGFSRPVAGGNFKVKFLHRGRH